VAEGHREMYHIIFCNIEPSQKKSRGFFAHGLLGNQLIYKVSDDLKTMGGRP
jgi:hypothetical protein